MERGFLGNLKWTLVLGVLALAFPWAYDLVAEREPLEPGSIISDGAALRLPSLEPSWGEDDSAENAGQDPAPSGYEAPKGAAVASGGFTPAETLKLCPRITVTNAPAADPERNVQGYHPFVTVNGVTLAVVPTTDACLSSGFGQRRGRLHKGIDLQGDPVGLVYSGGAGIVVEAAYRDDFGNYVLIDHGSGVFTRYAHLQSLSSNAKVGNQLALGVSLGKMGNTAGYQIPVHLHYELLLGDYATQKKSFGLTPKDILSYL